MELIIGGAYMGKLTWAAEHFGLAREDLCDLAEGYLPGKRCYYHLETALRDPAFAFRREDYPEDVILICRETGSGVVPMDPEERAWRERVGSLLQQLAGEAGSVTRIFCGLPERLK